MSNPVKILITIDPCCERIRYLADILQQARTLNLSDNYQSTIENLILDLMTLVSAQNSQGVVDLYDSSIDSILALRDSAFDEWKDDVKCRHVPVPKSPPAP